MKSQSWLPDTEEELKPLIHELIDRLFKIGVSKGEARERARISQLVGSGEELPFDGSPIGRVKYGARRTNVRKAIKLYAQNGLSTNELTKYVNEVFKTPSRSGQVLDVLRWLRQEGEVRNEKRKWYPTSKLKE